jgi:ribonuclease P protein component
VALPYVHRLKHRHDFEAVYQSGIRRRSAHFQVVALYLNGGDAQMPSRFGISISKKVSKLAVVRNRIKRRIRSALRTLLPRVQPGWWVVIVVRSSAATCNYWEILQELEQLLLKTEVLHHGD